MKIGNVKHIKIAKKYSNALISGANDEDKAAKVYEDLLFIEETINTNPNLQNVLLNPVISISDKKDIVNKLFRLHIDTLSLDFVVLLIENNRLDIFNEVVNQYINTYNIQNNIAKPTIISAIELDKNQKNRIIDKLANKLTKKIVPNFQINPDIIGGLVIEIDDKTVDFSLKTKFDNMKKQLTKGNRYGND
jgi:F-type H+-transporting ATPase subunit delta